MAWCLDLLVAVTLRHHQAAIVITVPQIDRRIRPHTSFGRQTSVNAPLQNDRRHPGKVSGFRLTQPPLSTRR